MQHLLACRGLAHFESAHLSSLIYQLIAQNAQAHKPLLLAWLSSLLHHDVLHMMPTSHMNRLTLTSHHITSHHITSHHITSHHITSHHITSHQITPHHITSHHKRVSCTLGGGLGQQELARSFLCMLLSSGPTRLPALCSLRPRLQGVQGGGGGTGGGGGLSPSTLSLEMDSVPYLHRQVHPHKLHLRFVCMRECPQARCR